MSYKGFCSPRGNFVDHYNLVALCLTSILQHVSPLAPWVLRCDRLLYMLPIKMYGKIEY